jgi:superfamily II DNA or RNA helicase
MQTIVLRDYQDRMIVEARTAIRNNVKRLLLQAPCGAGKTVIASAIIKAASERGKSVTFMTHRGELAKQGSKTFLRFDIPHAFIWAAFSPNQLKLVQIAMIDTLRNRVKKLPVPDILVIDECHHAVSASWRVIIEYYHSQGTLIIGLSATPQRLDGRPLNDLFDYMVRGPAPKELIARGALSKFKYFAPPMVANLDGVGTSMGDFDQKEAAVRINTPKVFGDAIDHYKSHLPGKRAIAFCVNIKGSQALVDQFNAEGIPAAHVDGEMPQDQRAAAIKAFEAGDILILSNVSLFGEGFDVAACDGVIMLRATQSLSLHIQMCGRALRPHDSKEVAIILDHVGNITRHGLPDEDHDWSLEGRKKKKGKKKEDDAPLEAALQCPKCYQVFSPAPVCPHCGHVFEVKRSTDVAVDVKLEEVTPEQAAAMARDRKNQVANAKSLDELKKIGAERGYKPGWAKHIWEARGKKASTAQLPPAGHPAFQGFE